ncbi:hypothetical protein [Streptomyces sp. NPDC047108]|uniref:hypothetical protein n=1 Tax=Streptomyces sp. NPDC047108 TaxID=3155025 RepID=UPI0033DA5CC7
MPKVPNMPTADALTQVSAIGPYFAVACGPRPDDAGFRPLTDLYEDAAAQAGYVTTIERRLGTGGPRVAASTLHIGTAARLWSIALATAALTGRVPDLAPERLWWRTPESGPVDLWLREVPALAGGELSEGLYETVLVRNLLPLGDALRQRYGLSARILPGNAASALIGAVPRADGPRPGRARAAAPARHRAAGQGTPRKRR